MSEPQAAPVGSSSPAAPPPPAPAAGGEAKPQPQHGDFLGDDAGSDDSMGKARDEAIALLKGANVEEDAPSVEVKKPEADKKIESEKKPDEGGKVTREARVAKMKEALEGLSEDERSEFLGANNKAFAALAREEQKVRGKVREFEQAQQTRNAEYVEWQKTVESRNTEYKEWEEVLKKGARDPDFLMQYFNWTKEKIQAYYADPARHVAGVERNDELEATKKRQDELEKRQKDLDAEREQQTEAHHEAKWKNQVAEHVNAVTAESHPTLTEWMTNSLADGVDNPRQKVFEEVLMLQDRAFRGILVGFTGVKLPKETVLATKTALAYIDATLLRQQKRLTGGRKTPDPQQGGAETTARPEEKTVERPRDQRPPTDDDGGEMVKARSEAARLARELFRST